ncbi:MAG: hypothetical protein IS632_04805 [Thaumarchaeota archaeon]|nr:hypothetical protein [Nitrososphaerota archaeon]
MPWEWPPNQTVQEAIRVAMQRLSKDGKRRVTKKHILKVLFLARERLPDGNSVKQELAYYWYKEGPYSEIVDANIDHMMDAGLVSFHKTDTSQTYKLKPSRALKPVASGVDVDLAKDEISQVAYDNSDVTAAVKSAYRVAPHKWYTTYNRRFGPRIDRHFEDILAGRTCRHSSQEILSELDDAVLDYPTDPNLMGHRMAFMDCAKMLNAFLRRESYHTDKDTTEMLQNLCAAVWDVFAYGMRVYHHDPQYDSRMEKWMAKYNEELHNLDRETIRSMEVFGDVGVDVPDMSPEMEDLLRHPENHVFTPLSLGDVAKGE